MEEVPSLIAVICAMERTLHALENWHYRHWGKVTLVLCSFN